MYKFFSKQDFTLIKSLLIVMFVSIYLYSCTSSDKTSEVKMKVDNKTAHISLGSSEVVIGDKVYFYQSKCGAVNNLVTHNLGDGDRCELNYLGEGKIKRLFNEKYSEVETDGQFQLEKGILVRKKELYSE